MSSTRPKGFIEWEPNSQWRPVIQAVNEILDEYRSYGPMTVRQIFYRLVGAYGYDKTELAYKRLVNALVKARRARLVRFSDIRDDGGTRRGGPHGYTSVGEFLDDLEESFGGYYRDTFEGQPLHILMFCEAEGLVPMLAGMVEDYRVQVTGTGGFASVTVNYNLAREIAARRHPTVFMHLGDHDPSGVSIFESMSQDIGKFVAELHGGSYYPNTGQTDLSPNDDGPDFRPMRVALTADQVDELGLDTAPPKASDSRSANWVGDTTQLEALAPPQLKAIVDAAIEPLIDWGKVDSLKALQDAEDEVIERHIREGFDDTRADILRDVEDIDLEDDDDE